MIALQLIGPTGIGKTHWGERLAKYQGIQFQDLDAHISPEGAEFFLMQQGARAFWKRSQAVLHDFEASSNPYIVAIGAGTQWVACEFGEATQLLSIPTCTLWCEPVKLLHQLKNFRQDSRSLEQLLATEYTRARSELYLGARVYIDRTDLSEQQLWAALRTVYQRV